jgi:hypothetical protein
MTVTALAMVVLAGIVGAADEEDRVILHAETQLGTANGWHGEGEVQIVYQDIEIRCDEADWDRATGMVVARGNVTESFHRRQGRIQHSNQSRHVLQRNRLHRPDVYLYWSRNRKARRNPLPDR